MKSMIPNRFSMIRCLRSDSNSVTFIGTDHVLERPEVLIKVIRNVDCAHAVLAQRFSWFKGLNHPHFAAVLDAGLTQKHGLYAVREYLSASELHTGNHSEAMKALVSAVRFLHANDCIHGALKPSNIFFSSGVLKLTDPRIEGIQTVPSGDENLRFTAPEVLKGGRVTIDSDLYSIGMILYRLLTGRDPFDDGDIDHLKSKYLCASARSITDFCHVSKSLSNIVGQLIDKDPMRRRAAFEALVECLGTHETFAVRAPFVGRQAVKQQIEQIVEDKPRRGLRVLLIEGEPGIGKSRLVDEVRTRCSFSSIVFIVSQCVETIASECQPVVQGIRKLLRMLGIMNAPLRVRLEKCWPTLSKFFDSSLNRGEGQQDYPLERVVNELVGFLASVGRRYRIVFVIEDIHHADLGTREFIKQLFFRAAEAPLTLVLTRRTDSRPSTSMDIMNNCPLSNLIRIRLMPITEAESRSHVQFLTSLPEQQEIALRMSAGNPLFIEQYIQTRTAALDESTPALDNAVTWILSRVAKDSQPIAESLSVFQQPVGVHLLSALAEAKGPELQTKLLELEWIGLAETGAQGIIVKYPAVRTKLYSNLSQKQKTYLNSCAYQLLDKANHGRELLAHHLFEAKQFKQASPLYQKLAEENYNEKNFINALRLYQRLEHCEKFDGSSLLPIDRTKMANCYKWTGGCTTSVSYSAFNKRRSRGS